MQPVILRETMEKEITVYYAWMKDDSLNHLYMIIEMID